MDERAELLRYLKYGRPADCPAWYVQLRIAQTLHCAPWEAFPQDRTPRAVWVQRASAVMHAEHEAREHHRKQAERKSRMSRREWTFTHAVAAVPQTDDGLPLGKVTTTG